MIIDIYEPSAENLIKKYQKLIYLNNHAFEAN